MSDQQDLDRELIEEDRLSTILRTPDRGLVVPPFSAIARRAERNTWSSASAFGAAAMVVVVIAAALGAWRATSTASVGSAPASCAASPTPPPSVAYIGPRDSGPWLHIALESVQPTDAQTNQMLWRVRFAVPAGAPAGATVLANATVTVGGPTGQQVVGYELEGTGRAVAEGEAVQVAPCSSLVLVVRTSGPLSDGAWRYTVSFDQIVRPEGGTVSETLGLALYCRNATRTCEPVENTATTTPAPTPTPGSSKP